MRADEIKAILESIGKRPTKRLGQHFMLDESILKRMVVAADLKARETVLEIGPGLGNLTEELLRTGAKVVAVEQDSDFVKFLKRRFGERLDLVEADAVKAFLPQFDKVVSNLPYQISSPITFKLLDIGFETAVLMLQREFAERMVAKPGTQDYGRLTVGVYFRADCQILFDVPKTSFWPQPKVDSCVVKLAPRPPPFKVGDPVLFAEVTRAIFSHRRKKILNSIKADSVLAGKVPAHAVPLLAGLPYASKRAEELAPEMMGELTDALEKLISSSRRTA
jgi:16S rRNA (adenine1518-N6/adenine1519-N6)-dimethyltransferase